MEQKFFLSLAFKTAPEPVRAKLMLTVSTQTRLGDAYRELAAPREAFQPDYDAYVLAAGKVTGRTGPSVDVKNEKLAAATAALETFGKAIEAYAMSQDNPVLLTQLGFKTTSVQPSNHSQVDFGEGQFEVCERADTKGSVRVVCTCTNSEGLRGFKIRYSVDEGATWQDGGITRGTKLTVKNLPLEKKYLFACQPFGTWGREGSWTQTPVTVWVV